MSDTWTWGELTSWQEELRPGDPVEVRWGYGSGFRARGRGVIDQIYRQSFRVRLTAPVRLSQGAGWPEGFVLKSIPRAYTAAANGEHGVFPDRAARGEVRG